MTTTLPYPRIWPEKMTWPAVAAWLGAPYGAPMSMPVWMRPHRYPNGELMGPEAGQIRPAPDTRPATLAATPGNTYTADCRARMSDERFESWAATASASAWKAE